MNDIDETASLAKRADVILCVGNGEEGTLRIGVSSASMSVASPVFEAMFDGRFAEGQALSSSNPQEVALPDDNPASMLLLCQIAHLKNSDIPRQLKVDALADFAVLCDKYNSVDAVRAWGRVWVAELLPEPGALGFEKLVMVTYTLDLPDEFSKVTRSLIINRTFSVDIEVAAHGTDFLPLKVLAQLHKAQNYYFNKIGPALMPTELTLMLSCASGKSIYAEHMNYARQAGVFPPTSISLQEYRDRYAKIKRVAKGACKFGCSCQKGDQVLSIALEAIDEVLRSAKGMCLDCLYPVEDAADKKHCRAEHTKLPY